MSSSTYYRRKNYNDDENERNLYARAISTVATATAAASFSERIKALESAGMKDTTFVKKRIPENKTVSNTVITVNKNNHYEEDGDFIDNNNNNNDDKNSFNNKTSNFECPPFKPPSRTPSYDSLPHSPNIDDPNIKAFTYNINNDYDNDDSEKNISINSPDDCITAVKLVAATQLLTKQNSGILSTKPPTNNNYEPKIQTPPQPSPQLSPKFDNRKSVNNLFNNIINKKDVVSQRSRSSSWSSSSSSSSSSPPTPPSPPSSKTKIYNTNKYDDNKNSNNNNNNQLIFNSDYTKNMSQNYHSDHFTCGHCDQSLSGSRYILKDDQPYCIRCYEELFAHVCEECKRKIGTDSKDLSYKDRHWHEKCFFCSVCKIGLIDKPFGSKNDALFCGECYTQKFASRCDKCTQIFKPGMKKMEYKGQQFHENCFVCFTCNNPIGTKSFIPKENRIYCVPCYEDQFATKCTRCVKVISQGGVTYKNQPFHRECFTCTNCHQSLAGQRFTSRDDHPYCSDCFGKLFAKKCSLCTKPITVDSKYFDPKIENNGIGGTKYISFEDRHWHNDCFKCNNCHTSLVGRGFLTEGPDILCPDCGRN